MKKSYLNNFEKFRKKKQELLIKYNKANRELNIKYALANSKVNVGDVIKSSSGISIKVEEISVFLVSEKPTCIYSGTRLTKNGNLFKSGEKYTMFQSYVKEINGKNIMNTK